jgi:protein SERAC1
LAQLRIVAVHGLLGDCYETWTSESPTGTKTLLLNDLLLRKRPNTRVMTYGYNGSLASPSVEGVEDNARRLLNLLRTRREVEDSVHIPLVFIGHGIGGLIIKQVGLALAVSVIVGGKVNKLTHTPDPSTQALIIADNERESFSAIADNTKGIVFFGTPHRGLSPDVVGLLNKMAVIMSLVSRSAYPDPDFDDYLRPNAVKAMDIAEDFRPSASKYVIVSFIETKKVRWATGLHWNVSIVLFVLRL